MDASAPVPIDKPYSPACDRNRDPILAVLRTQFAGRRRVLEIGSGTGQHAVHFAAALPGLSTWQTTDRDPALLAGIQRWLDEAALPANPAPRRLDVTDPGDWQALAAGGRYDAVFSANTLHYMPWSSVQALFAHVPSAMTPGARLLVYGPFNLDGRYTSDSNAQFDVWLKQRDPSFAIRDLGDIDALAGAQGLVPLARIAMPANNFCAVWSFEPAGSA